MALPTPKPSSTSSINQQAQTNTTKDSFTTVTVEQAVVNVFFDGTKNNMYNIDARKSFATKIAKDPNGYESYSNAYSNVAHLYSNRIEKDDFWVYVEGMGSAKYQKDSTQGFAFGCGETGVTERAKGAFLQIRKEVQVKNITPHMLILNVFGFSRGSATARHFVHLAKTQPERFGNWNLKPAQIRFRFIGIFDTVSSYHPNFSILPNFDNDVNELCLDFRVLNQIDKQFTKVFHITAADEYREYFSLTNIAYALREKFGCEIVMHGAHSDIGGSYENGLSDGYQITNEQLKKWFLGQGFYKEDNIHFLKNPNPKAIGGTYIAKKTNIPNDYHKISLRLMRLIAQQVGLLEFKSELLKYEVENNKGIIKELIERYPAQVQAQFGWGKRIDLRLQDKAQAQALRHQYLHWSAKKTYQDFPSVLGDDVGYTIRLSAGLPYRKIHNG